MKGISVINRVRELMEQGLRPPASMGFGQILGGLVSKRLRGLDGNVGQRAGSMVAKYAQKRLSDPNLFKSSTNMRGYQRQFNPAAAGSALSGIMSAGANLINRATNIQRYLTIRQRREQESSRSIDIDSLKPAPLPSDGELKYDQRMRVHDKLAARLKRQTRPDDDTPIPMK
jgi:hypothetical protein